MTPSSRPQPKSAERDRRDSDVLKKFLRKLEDAQSNADIKSLLSECPTPHAHSYQFYLNLAFFVEHFVPPRSAGISETVHYIRLSEKLRARGEADNDTRVQMVAAFKAAGADRR